MNQSGFNEMLLMGWVLITAHHGRQAEVAVTPEAETSKKDHFWMSVKRIIQQFCPKVVWGDEVFIDIDSHKWSYKWVTGMVLYNPGCKHYTTPLKNGRVTMVLTTCDFLRNVCWTVRVAWLDLIKGALDVSTSKTRQVPYEFSIVSIFLLRGKLAWNPKSG